MGPVYKKRKLAPTKAVDELKFDFDAREDYLTGFHKRRVQRVKHAREENAKKEREEKIVARKEIRDQRKQDLERHVAEVNAILRKNNPDISDSETADGDGEWDGITEDAPSPPRPDGVDEYIDEDKYTTVTIETMDDPRKLAYGDGSDDEAGTKVVEEATEGKDGEDAGDKKKRVWTKEKPKKSSTDKVKKKKQKFRYESKAERVMTRKKQKSKNTAAAKERKAKK